MRVLAGRFLAVVLALPGCGEKSSAAEPGSNAATGGVASASGAGGSIDSAGGTPSSDGGSVMAMGGASVDTGLGGEAPTSCAFVASEPGPTDLPEYIPVEPQPDFCAGFGPDRTPTSLLDTFASQYSTLAEWEARAQRVREGIQKKMRLYPWPEKTPLNPIIHSYKEHAALGISIENVAIESVPGFFMTGNLYRPLGCTGQVPGILRPHGHAYAKRFGEDVQKHAAALASMGAIVFAYDMIGRGENDQITHCFPEAVVAAQTWNSIRALDFLLSIGADPDRIAITGGSGGGTQSYLAAALDPRIKLTAPGVIVGGTEDGVWMGGGNCEATGMGINKDDDPNNDIEDYETNSIDMAALAAPSFQLILSDSEDTLAPNAPTTTMPYLKNVYALYGAEDRVDNFHDNTGHNYAYNKRVASYHFFIEHFQMGPDLPDEDLYELYPASELRVFTEEHQRPDRALTSKQEIIDAFLQ